MGKYLLILILLIPLVYPLEECKRIIEVADVPCQVTSTWDYPNDCNTYEATVYNESGASIESYPLGDFGIYCNWTFNHSRLGSYYYNITSGDSGNILIDDEQMMLSLVIGVGIVAALLLLFAFKLDDEHFILKLLFTISAITVLMLIPLSIFIPDGIGVTFYRLFLGIFVLFWLYVATYFTYWLIKKMQRTVQE